MGACSASPMPCAIATPMNTTREYDKAGRLIKETRPLGGANTYAYDKAGGLTQRVDAGGNTRYYAL